MGIQSTRSQPRLALLLIAIAMGGSFAAFVVAMAIGLAAAAQWLAASMVLLAVMLAGLAWLPRRGEIQPIRSSMR